MRDEDLPVAVIAASPAVFMMWAKNRATSSKIGVYATVARARASIGSESFVFVGRREEAEGLEFKDVVVVMPFNPDDELLTFVKSRVRLDRVATNAVAGEPRRGASTNAIAGEPANRRGVRRI